MRGIKTLKNPKKIADVKIGTTNYSFYLADKVYENGLKGMLGKKVLGKIVMNKKYKSKSFIAIDTKARNKKHIFYHEVTHGLLYELSKIKKYRFTALKILSEDEHFVDTFSHIIEKTFRMRNVKQYGAIAND